MKKNSFTRILYVFTLILAIGCSKDNESINEQEITGAQVRTVLEADDIAGIADTIVSDVYIDANSISGKTTQKSAECYEGAHGETGFTLTFTDCTALDGKLMNGTITVLYGQGEGSTTFTATYTDFSVGDILINGTRSFSFDSNMEANSYAFTVTSDMTVVMENEDVISVNGTKEFGFEFGESFETSTFSVDGTWTIKVNNDTYNIDVTDMLVGNLSCTYFTTGAATFSKNGLTVDIDFGDGECDDLATMTYPNGVVKEIHLDN